MILNASGCLDGLEAPEVARALDVFVTKTVTPEPREGNRPVRIAETDAGMLNSIGLENPGIDGLLHDKLPRLAELGVTLWFRRRLRGGRLCAALCRARRLARGGRDRAQPLVPECRRSARKRRRARRRGPSADSEAALREALAGRDRPARNRPCRPVRGADGLAREHDPRPAPTTRHPAAARARARRLLRAPPRPIALAAVYQCYRATGPIVGMGGIVATGRDALEFLAAVGASSIALGTVLRGPRCTRPSAPGTG